MIFLVGPAHEIHILVFISIALKSVPLNTHADISRGLASSPKHSKKIKKNKNKNREIIDKMCKKNCFQIDFQKPYFTFQYVVSNQLVPPAKHHSNGVLWCADNGPHFNAY